MSKQSIGQLCTKIAGRDAGQQCIIIDVIDKTFVLIDGNTRRRKCNIQHLVFLGQKADIKAKASHEDVMAEIKKFGITPRTPGDYTKKPRKAPSKKEEKKAAKAAKKEEKKATKAAKKPAKKAKK